MTKRHIVYRRRPAQGSVGQQLSQRFVDIRHDLEVPEDFPPEVVVAAQHVMHPELLPDDDATDVPFVTIDPPGSMDLDQAMHPMRQGEGYRARYAIADVPALVWPGGPIDVEARKRGQTIYCPDLRVQLHPSALSEGAASLLPDTTTRPAYVWGIALDADGEMTDVSVARSMVRSVERYDYKQVQEAIDQDTADECVGLLKEIDSAAVSIEGAVVLIDSAVIGSRPSGIPPMLVADESAGRPRQGLGPAEERPGSEGQGGGQQPPGVTRGTVPQKTDRQLLLRQGLVRVKRWCKRPPALQVTGAAR